MEKARQEQIAKNEKLKEKLEKRFLEGQEVGGGTFPDTAIVFEKVSEH